MLTILKIKGLHFLVWDLPHGPIELKNNYVKCKIKKNSLVRIPCRKEILQINEFICDETV